jgi:hypothetical protein
MNQETPRLWRSTGAEALALADVVSMDYAIRDHETGLNNRMAVSNFLEKQRLRIGARYNFIRGESNA